MLPPSWAENQRGLDSVALFCPRENGAGWECGRPGSFHQGRIKDEQIDNVPTTFPSLSDSWARLVQLTARLLADCLLNLPGVSLALAESDLVQAEADVMMALKQGWAIIFDGEGQSKILESGQGLHSCMT